MIIREFYRMNPDGVKLYITYSDKGYLIKQVETGACYTKAIDVEGATYTYEETEEYPEVMQDYDELNSRVENIEDTVNTLLGVN